MGDVRGREKSQAGARRSQEEGRGGLGWVLGAGTLALGAGAAGIVALAQNWERVTAMPIGTAGAIALLGAGSLALARGTRWLFDTAYERVRAWQRDGIDIRVQEMRSRIHVLRPDEYGRHGISFDGEVYRDLDTLAVYDQAITRVFNPVLEELRWQHAQLQALSHVALPHSYSNHVENITGDSLAAGAADEVGEGSPALLPERVTLEEMTQRWGPGSYHKMYFGVAVDPETGQQAPVVGDMRECVHVLAAGGPGWGKSTLLESMAKQLVVAGDCDLAFVDLGVNTFGQVAKYGLYPIADSAEMVVALFQVLAQEMQRRYDLFKEYPQVKDLRQFNQVAGQDLRPLVVFVDEAPVLFDAEIGATQLATDLARMGRKVGLDLVLGGTDFRADTLPTSARGAFGARVAMHFDEPSLSRSLIRSSQAVNIRTRGRALALLPGQVLTELQAPIVTRWDDLPAPRPTITLQPAARPAAPPAAEGMSDAQVDRILELYYGGMKATPIASQVFGYANARTVDQVRAVIAEYDSEENDNDTDDNTPADGVD